jgi:hypothetical protein
MIWVLPIPAIIYLTFQNMITSDFPGLSMDGHQIHRNFLEWAFCLAVSAFFSGLISMVPLGIGMIAGSLPERVGRFDRDYPLVALREKDGVTGQFYFLGAGSINDTQYYFWYRKDGGHISGGKTVRESGVRIYQDDTPPRMVTFKTEYVSPIWDQIGWLIMLDVRDPGGWCPDFHIPPGSIKEGFQL